MVDRNMMPDNAMKSQDISSIIETCPREKLIENGVGAGLYGWQKYDAG